MDYLTFIDECRSKDYSNLKTHRHHILPKSDGGSDDLDNLIELSIHDHYWAHVFYAEQNGTCGTAPHFILYNFKADLKWTEEEWDKAARIASKLNSESKLGCIPWNKGKGYLYTKETRKKMSDSRKLWKHSEESKMKVSQRMMGNHYADGNTSRRGKKVGEEGRRNMRIARAKIPPEKRQVRLGIKHSEETKLRISKSKMGTPSPNKGKCYYNDGKRNVFSDEKNCPDGFVKGYLQSDAFIKNFKEKPNTTKGTKWYNNGIINVRRENCPDGFVEGVFKRERDF